MKISNYSVSQHSETSKSDDIMDLKPPPFDSLPFDDVFKTMDDDKDDYMENYVMK